MLKFSNSQVMSAHEDLSRTHSVRGGSDRSFGLTFALFFLLLGFWPLMRGRPVRTAWVAAGAAILAIALIRASVLGPLNRVWTRVGALLNRVASPVVSALVFFAAVTPIAVFLRWNGKDPLRLRLDQDAASYWLCREPPGPEPATMTHQF